MVSVKQPVNLPRQFQKCFFAVILGVAWSHGEVPAGTPASQPVIESLTVVGTNLVFRVNLPLAISEATLEIRPDLTTPWQDAATLDISNQSGVIEFTLPKPVWDSAFFRLRSASATATPQLSAELKYVTIPSLSVSATHAVFHFKGIVDGSDRIVLNHQGAFWEHVNWDWPAGEVSVNDTKWNPREKNYLTTTGAVAFLPETFSLATARLEIMAGRDVVALERTAQALIIYLNDTPTGAAAYEFKIHFSPAPPRAKTTGPSRPATLKVAAVIDGSDTLRITKEAATWKHRAFQPAQHVTLNGISWNVRQTQTLLNAGTNTFLPAAVNFSSARIISRKGRDVATAWAEPDALLIQFADNPNGADSYELEIAFE